MPEPGGALNSKVAVLGTGPIALGRSKPSNFTVRKYPGKGCSKGATPIYILAQIVIYSLLVGKNCGPIERSKGGNVAVGVGVTVYVGVGNGVGVAGGGGAAALTGTPLIALVTFIWVVTTQTG